VSCRCRELSEQLKRTEIASLKAEPVTPFETAATAAAAAAATQQQPARARRGSNRSSTSAARSGGGGGGGGGGAEEGGQQQQVGGLEESKLLKQELKARGLPTKGSKAELRARLAAAKAADV
jgi:hypothetical protein